MHSKSFDATYGTVYNNCTVYSRYNFLNKLFNKFTDKIESMLYNIEN